MYANMHTCTSPLNIRLLRFGMMWIAMVALAGIAQSQDTSLPNLELNRAKAVFDLKLAGIEA